MKNPFVMCWRAYNRYLDSHPFSSTLVTAGFLYGCGDLMCQAIEIVNHGETRSKSAHAHDASGAPLKESIFTLLDYQRAARMTAYGTVVFGITSFYWYKWLDTYLVNLTTKIQVFAKVALDEFVYAPFCITSLFGVLSALEGKNAEQIKQKIRNDFWPTFRVDLIVWPLLQTINFYLLPLKYRILFISCCSLVWNIFLSSMYNNQNAQVLKATETTGTELPGGDMSSGMGREEVALAELQGVGLHTPHSVKEEQV